MLELAVAMAATPRTYGPPKMRLVGPFSQHQRPVSQTTCLDQLCLRRPACCFALAVCTSLLVEPSLICSSGLVQPALQLLEPSILRLLPLLRCLRKCNSASVGANGKA